LFERWPTAQEVTKDHGIPVFEPVQHLWVILLECAGHAIRDANHIIDQATALLNERGQGAHGSALQLEGL